MGLSNDGLRDRWKTEDGKERLAAVVTALQNVEDWGHILEGFPGIDEIETGRDLRGSNLSGARLEGADLHKVRLEGADLIFARLEDAGLFEARLEGARLWGAHLKGAKLISANLEGAEITNCNLSGAKFLGAEIDNKSDFRGSNIESMLCSHETLNHIKYNNRRMNWEDWYKKKRNWPSAPFVRLFWLLTNYGVSTFRLFLAFTLLAAVFAVGYWQNPETISHLQKVDQEVVASYEYQYVQVPLIGSFPVPASYETETIPVPVDHLFLRALYFSVVTMTTLGFGDMYAAPNSQLGHILLMAQVILGYILLGALITRLGILFQSGGPTDIKK